MTKTEVTLAEIATEPFLQAPTPHDFELIPELQAEIFELIDKRDPTKWPNLMGSLLVTMTASLLKMGYCNDVAKQDAFLRIFVDAIVLTLVKNDARPKN